MIWEQFNPLFTNGSYQHSKTINILYYELTCDRLRSFVCSFVRSSIRPVRSFVRSFDFVRFRSISFDFVRYGNYGNVFLYRSWPYEANTL